MDLFLFLLAELTYRAHAGSILRSAADDGFIDDSLLFPCCIVYLCKTGDFDGVIVTRNFFIQM